MNYSRPIIMTKRTSVSLQVNIALIRRHRSIIQCLKAGVRLVEMPQMHVLKEQFAFFPPHVSLQRLKGIVHPKMKILLFTHTCVILICETSPFVFSIRKKVTFEITWGWVNDVRILIFEWTIPLSLCKKISSYCRHKVETWNLSWGMWDTSDVEYLSGPDGISVHRRNT